jgi:hypothetical protein
MNPEVYLIKQAILWSAKRPALAQSVAMNQARVAGVPVRTWSSKAHPIAYVPIPVIGGIRYNPSHPLSQQPHFGEVLQHELSEAKYKAISPKSRVVSVDPLNLPGIQRMVGRSALGATASGLLPSGKRVVRQMAYGGVLHNDPRVLLDESYRIASGQVSPETAKMLFDIRRSTGETAALHGLGVAYGKSLIQPESAAYARALRRFQQPAVMSQGYGGTVYNLKPLYDKVIDMKKARLADLTKQLNDRTKAKGEDWFARLANPQWSEVLRTKGLLPGV